MTLQSLQREYATTLGNHLATADEASLHRAYELGRNALGEGLGVLDLVLLHHGFDLLPGIAAGFNQVLVCFLQLVFVQFQLRLRQVQLVLDFVLLIRFRLRKCSGEVIHTLLIGGEQRL